MRIGGCQKTSLVDFPGKVAAVVFAQGCDFRCPWCHNRQLVDPDRFGPGIPVDDVFRHLAARVGKLSGVVVSGGEPTLQPGLADFFGQVRALGFSTKLDTNGSRPGVVEGLVSRGLLDFVAVDLKAPWDRYDEACGKEVDADALRGTIAILRSSGIAHQLRTTDWAEFSSAERAEIEAIARGSPHVWQPFRHPAHGN